VRYTFLDCTIDLRTRVLSRRGRPLAIEPKAFDVLAYLVRHRDRVVFKDELMRELWPKLFVTELTVSKSVSRARLTIGDMRSRRKVIQTVHGRGFRFIAPVKVTGTQSRHGADLVGGTHCPQCRTELTAAPGNAASSLSQVSASEEGTPALRHEVLLPRRPPTEHRQLIVLFADLLVPKQLDGDALEELRQRYHRICSALVTRDGSWLLFGSSMLAYFSLPETDHDGVRRVIRLGRDLVSAIDRVADVLSAPGAVPVSVKIGIHASTVSLGGVDPRMALCESVTIASALQRVAAPGEVVLSGSVLRLVSGISTLSLGERSVHGIAHPIATYRLLTESYAPALEHTPHPSVIRSSFAERIGPPYFVPPTSSRIGAAGNRRRSRRWQSVHQHAESKTAPPRESRRVG